MRKPTTVIALMVLLLSACSADNASGSSDQPQVINVNNSEANPSGISVSGTGIVTGKPDTVSIDLGVSVIAKTVAEATSRAAEKAQGLIDSLTANGVAEDDITTTNYSIHPQYDYSGNRERLIGYQVNNTVRVKIRNVAETGSVIDAATTGAGDEVRVNGLQFSIDDDSEMIEAARAAAWADALAKATQLAELSGQTLGAAMRISETVSRPPTPVPFARDAEAAALVQTPIQSGTADVSIMLEVQFALGQ